MSTVWGPGLLASRLALAWVSIPNLCMCGEVTASGSILITSESTTPYLFSHHPCTPQAPAPPGHTVLLGSQPMESETHGLWYWLPSRSVFARPIHMPRSF